MRDLGFTPARGKHPLREVKELLRSSLEHGLGNPPVRWVLLAAPFTMGVSVYAFYAMQPYLMQLYGDPNAYGIAGLAAAIVGGAQIAGGLLAPHVGRLFRRRTSVLLASAIASTLILALIGLVPGFWAAISLLVLWGLVFAVVEPVRQAYLNALILSKDRATVLSFDSLLSGSRIESARHLTRFRPESQVGETWSVPDYELVFWTRARTSAMCWRRA